MKKQTFTQIAVAILFLFLCSLPAYAQSLENLMTVQIPFEFQVGEKSLPAGKYVIKRDSQLPKLLQIQCPERKISVTVYTIPLNLPKEPTRTSLTFTEYGEKHFLSEVKIWGRDLGYALTKSKTEHRLAQNLGSKTIRTIPNSSAKN